MRARRRLARIQDTLDDLVSEKASPRRGGSKGLLPLIQAVVEAGVSEARVADLERVRVEVLRRQEEWAAACLEMQLASAELARLIRLDPATPLWPVEDFRGPIPLPGDAWSCQPVEELVAVALTNRPDLVEAQAQVEALVEQVRAAHWRPLLPNVTLAYAWGDFGGSPDPLPGSTTSFGPSGRILHFNTRTEFDVSVVWRLQNLGFGNRAEVHERSAAQRQALFRKLQVVDRVVAQVVQAEESIVGWWKRIQVLYTSLFDAAGAPSGPAYRSIRLNFERIRGAEGRVLELLDSIRTLADLLDAYAGALTDYERARFRLLIALGIPPKAFLEPATFPQPSKPPNPKPPIPNPQGSPASPGPDGGGRKP
jgi:outer membrane protein TolC